MMDDTTKVKIKETRAKNMAIRAAQRATDAALKQSARMALQRVFESPDATTEQVLEAAKLLAKLGCH